jgi:chromate transporter
MTTGVGYPQEPWLKLFLRFLRFGALAWGGPVAQIGMIRQELVDEERWISSAQFNRVLAVYQILPGPEAHELCVYFGMRSRGRWGGVVAGLGFMLPGFVLMFALSWAYVRYGLKTGGVQSVFAAVQVAVAALIVRAVFRIGGHVVTDRWLWAIAVIAAGAQTARATSASRALRRRVARRPGRRRRRRVTTCAGECACAARGTCRAGPQRRSAAASR